MTPSRASLYPLLAVACLILACAGATGFTPHQITDGLLVGVHRDELGVEKVRAHRLVK